MAPRPPPPPPPPITPATAPANSTARAGEVRIDPIFRRHVIFSPARSKRPSDFKSKPNKPNGKANDSCPFCLGHEHECAPEIFRVPQGTSDWKVRVIENLYPALHRDARRNGGGGGGGGRAVLEGYGIHDVVIETPHHHVHLRHLSAKEAAVVLLAYKERILQLKALGTLQYVQVFKNHGASAGASMSHSHSQIMGLPFVPQYVSQRLKSMTEYMHEKHKCSQCEVWAKDILINESSHFFAIIPFAASFPFEVWIIPRDHVPHFHEINHEKAVDLGGLLTLMLQKLSQQLNDPPFNFMIHTSPLLMEPSELDAHWFLQIVPQLSTVGGFEMGSGCYINPVFPEDAAKLLREVNLES